MPTLAEVVYAVTFGKPDFKNLDAAERKALESTKRVRAAVEKHLADEERMRQRLRAEVKKAADEEAAAKKRVADAVKKGVDEAAKADAAARAKILAGWKSTAGAIGKAIAAGIGAAIGGATGVFALVDRTTADLDARAKAARSSGLSGAAFQRLSFAARRGGASEEQLGAGFRFYNKQLQDARSGTGGDGLRAALGGIGLSLRELRDLNPEQQLGAIADALQQVSDPAARAAKLAAIFGEEAGPKLASTLEGGSAGLRELGDEAERLGVVLGDDALSQAEAFQDSVTNLKAQLQGLLVQGVGALIPVVEDYIAKAQEWIASNRELLAQKIQEYAAKLVEVFDSLVAVIRTVLAIGEKLVELFGGADNAMIAATATVGVFKLAMLGLPGVIAGVSIAVGLALGSMISDLAGFNEEIRKAREEAAGFAASATVNRAGADALTKLGELTDKGQIGSISDDEYNRLVDDALRSGQANGNFDQVVGVLNTLNRTRGKAVAKRRFEEQRRESVEGAAAFSKSGRAIQTSGGRGSKRSADEIVIDEFDIDELFGGEFRRLADREGLTARAVSDALEASAESLRRGSTKGVARNAGLGVLGGLAGKNFTTPTKDPLLSTLLGTDVPDIELSSIARGAQPQTLISTINNTFSFENSYEINGAGDPESVGRQIALQIRETFQGAIAASTKTAKVVFAR